MTFLAIGKSKSSNTKTASSGILDRCLRYLSVWRWLIACNARAEPALMGLTIICGIGGRLATLVGFALSVKAAAFILKPDLVFDFLAPYLPDERQEQLLLFIMVPGLAFCGGALAQILHNSSVLRLRNVMAERLALEAAEIKLSTLTSNDFGKRKPVTQVAADMRLGHGRLMAIEAMLINLIVTVVVLMIALIGGLLIDWFLMSVITSVGTTFALTTAAFRHLQSRAPVMKQELAKANTKSKITALPELIDPSADVVQNRRAVGVGLFDLAGTMSDVKSADQRFSNVSALILDLGQAIIVVTFLILLISSDATQMSMLIILVLIFRFFVSYLQTVTHTIIKLGPHYPFLVELWRTLKGVDEQGSLQAEKAITGPTGPIMRQHQG